MTISLAQEPHVLLNRTVIIVIHGQV